MTEQELSREMHRVADAVRIPDDLFPSGLLTRRPRRRPGWLVAAAVAAAVTLFAMTPLGARAVRAATEIIMEYTVRLVRTELPSESVPYLDAGSVQVGETITRDVPGAPKQVATGMLLKDVPPGWPLPASMAPGPDARAVLMDTYKPGTDTLIQHSLHVWWEVGDGRLYYSIHRRTEPMSADELAQLQKPELTVYTNDHGIRVEQQDVILKGQPTWATKVGPNWSLYWWHEMGGGSVSGNVPLADLLKVAESLPSLK